MARLPHESIDLVVTSPPYNLGTAYKTYKDRRKPSEFLDWCLQWGQQIQRVLKPEGSFFLNVGAIPSRPLLPHELAIAFNRLFKLQNTIHWIKSITIETKQNQQVSVGHFKPLNSRRFVNDCHEYVFHFTKTGKVPLDRLAVGVPYADKSNVRRWAHTEGADRRCRGNNWFIPYETIQVRLRDRPHPATFPKRLVTRCIRIHGQRKDLVMLDPFLGLGTSARAAQDCGIGVFYGFEIDPVYLEHAKRSLELE
ncbi:MAG: site-specific DNA-methyltransferase [Acidobacteria bacterium]|nr:site-specific DNA-methyltransferase [Acidobacteriota bacterium]